MNIGTMCGKVQAGQQAFLKSVLFNQEGQVRQVFFSTEQKPQTATRIARIEPIALIFQKQRTAQSA